MKTENFFLRYAYPCAYIIMQRGQISRKELEELEDTAVNNKDISREKLEKVFHRAFGFIDELAAKRGKSRWDRDIIEEYFYSYHNEVIDNGNGIYAKAPPMLKELSRVEKAEVIDKKGNVLLVEYADKKGNKKRRNVLSCFVAPAKAGDKVMIHYGYGIEKAD
ncbi:hypothetical protein GF323_02805 [Candidatus Woesearchaeota archaeon]|nr:hypothetical protein [Candidatus Woesearchaeota archaeon]